MKTAIFRGGCVTATNRIGTSNRPRSGALIPPQSHWSIPRSMTATYEKKSRASQLAIRPAYAR